MTAANGLLRVAGGLTLINAALHFFAFSVSGFNSWTMQFMVIGAVYGALGWGLTRGIGALAWVVFFISLCGMTAAQIAMSITPIADWLLGMIALVELAAAGVLFVHLWRK